MAYVERTTLADWKNQAAQVRNTKKNIDNELIIAKQKLRNIKTDAVLELAAVMTDKRIADARKKLQDEYDTLNESIRLEISRQNERYRRELDKLRKDINETNLTYETVKRRVNDINQRLDEALSRLEQAESGRKIRANAYASQLDAVIKRLRTKHPANFEALYPDRLAPGINAIEEALIKVSSNISKGDYEPSIGVAQTFISYAVGYQSQLDELNEEYQIALSETENALDLLQQTRDSSCRSILEMQVVINDDQFINHQDIDFWSAGIFSQIEKRIADAVSLMDLGIETYDAGVLKDAAKLFMTIRKQIDECRSIAERQFYLSCLCRETVYMIELVICRDGYTHWKELSSSFVESDLRERGTYQVILDNAYGATVHILVSPDRDRNSVVCDIEVFDNEGNTIKRDTVRNGILEELRQDRRTSCLNIQKTPYNEQKQEDLLRRAIGESERALDSWRGTAYRKIQKIM